MMATDDHRITSYDDIPTWFGEKSAGYYIETGGYLMPDEWPTRASRTFIPEEDETFTEYDENRGIDEYTSSGYLGLDRSSTLAEDVRRAMKTMVEPQTLYRGMKHEHIMPQGTRPGDIITMDDFYSFTRDPTVAFQYSTEDPDHKDESIKSTPAFVQIHAPPGSRGATFPTGESASLMDEAETVLSGEQAVLIEHMEMLPVYDQDRRDTYEERLYIRGRILPSPERMREANDKRIAKEAAKYQESTREIPVASRERAYEYGHAPMRPRQQFRRGRGKVNR